MRVPGMQMTVALTPVKSSNIEAIGHDGTHTHVKFKSGDVWKYPTTVSEHTALSAAPSVGKHFHANIKGRDGEKVS